MALHNTDESSVTPLAPRFPLKVSQDSRHLVTADGKPFPVIGDTAWSLIAQLNADDIVFYLDDRRQRGFNSIIVNLIEHKFADQAPAKIDGERPFLADGDFLRPNPRYFDYAVRTVRAAEKRGLSVWLCPAYLGWGGGDEGFFQEIKQAGPEALRMYGRYVGERFRDCPNVVWMVGGDYALPEEERWVGEELVLGLRDGGARQMVTAHGGQTTARETFGNCEWLVLDTVYSYRPDLWRRLRGAYQSSPVRPIVMVESTYEGEHEATPDQIRRQAWWAMTCGGCGQFFGNNPIWYFDGPGFVHMRSVPTWRQALDLPGSRDMARLGGFVRRIACVRRMAWQKLVPDLDDKLVTGGGGDGKTKATAAVAPDRTLAVVYVPSDGEAARDLTLDLSAFPARVSGRWFNPARDVNDISLDAALRNERLQRIRTPGNNGMQASDWVLVLEAQ